MPGGHASRHSSIGISSRKVTAAFASAAPPATGEDARFAQPEIELGCYPPVASALLPARIGAGLTLNVTGAVTAAPAHAQAGEAYVALGDSMAALSSGGLVGMYPASAKLPTWKVAECARLALAAVASAEDPWPAWLREAAGVPDLAAAFAPAAEAAGATA